MSSVAGTQRPGTEVEALYPGRPGIGRSRAGTGPGAAADQYPADWRPRRDPLRLAYLLGSMLSLDVEKEQALLEAPTRAEALRLLHGYLTMKCRCWSCGRRSARAAETEMTKQQREYMLRQQMQAIQEELGEKNPEKAEVEELRRRLTEADLPENVRKEAERELDRLERMPAAAPDYQMTRTYLEFVLELPWNKTTTDVIDLGHARQVLDEDHYDLQRDQGSHSRRPRGAEAESRGAGADPVPGRSARRRQNVAGPVDRPRSGPQVRAHEPRRHARRGGAARPSPHLHRRHAGPALQAIRRAGVTTRC